MVQLQEGLTPTEESECIFCGGRDSLEKQHAVPYWFMHEVHADPEVIHSFRLVEISSLMKGNFSFPRVIERDHRNRTDFWACGKCVLGWIGELEAAAIEPFGSLLQVTVSDVSHIESSVELLESNAHILSLGAFKTVLACDFAVDDVLVIPREHYRSCARQEIPKGVSVDLGFCREPSGFRILSGPLGNFEEYMTSCTYRVAFQSGHLVMMVRCIEGPMYDLYPGTISIYPQFRVGEELDVFSDSLEIIAWDLLAMAYYNEKMGGFYGLVET